jgi:predicted transglutaminase-like cysteine proteinase
MPLTQQSWRDLSEINDIVNQTVVARSDQDLFGVVDYWTIAGTFGDCEDYALTKQQMLRQRGWPRGSVLMTVVRDENGEGHAILTARTSRGDFVLDNRQPKIVAWNVTPYQFIKRQSVLNPRIWLALAPGLTPARDSAVAALSGSKR